MRRLVARVDAAVAAGERALIVALLAVMAGAVFLDALHRVFAAGEGRIERLVVAALPAGAERVARGAIAPGLLVAATFLAAVGAVRTRGGRGLRALALAGGLTVGLGGAVQLLVRALPNGLVWSQQMALCFMLPVALAGASLATRQHAHIAFELAGKIWPRPLRRPAEWAARLIAAGFSLLLALLAARYARDHHAEWASSDGAAGLFEAFRVPRWVVFGFLPIPLAVMGLRFLYFGVRPPETGGGPTP